MSIACLPWYDLPETRPFTDRFWDALSTQLVAQGFPRVPGRLRREVHHDEVLAHPDLLLSQTCGYVVAEDTRNLVQLVATPWYSAPDCSEGQYRSYVVVPRAHPARDLASTRGLRCAINELWSHSGVNALRLLVAPMAEEGRFFGSVLRSGSHLHSLQLLAEGQVDLACIDCVTFELVRRHRPELVEDLRVISISTPAPSPPFVTSIATDPGLLRGLRAAMEAVLADPGQSEMCEGLLIEGVEYLEIEAYDGMKIAADRVKAAGYVELEECCVDS